MPLQIARPRPVRAKSRSLFLSRDAREFSKQARQPVGGYAATLIGHSDRDLKHRRMHDRHPDRRRLLGVPGRVEQQVVQHLDYAPPVGHDLRKLRLKVEEQRVLTATTVKGHPSPHRPGSRDPSVQGVTPSVPVSIRATSSRSAISSRIWSVWESMIFGGTEEPRPD